MRCISFLFLFGLLFLSCSKSSPDQVSLLSDSFENEIANDYNLVFQFDKAVVSDDKMYQWDSTRYVSFDPPIMGRFKWSQSDQLMFSPYEALPPATSFSAEINQTVLKQETGKELQGKRSVIFSTSLLHLDHNQFSWSDDGILNLELSFNHAVSPDQLNENLKLYLDEKSVSFKIDGSEAERSHLIQIKPEKLKDKAADAVISISKSLLPIGGSNARGEDITLQAEVPSPYYMAVQEVTVAHDGASGKIMISTTQPVKLDQARKLVSVKPAVKFTLEDSDGGFSISSTGFKVDQSYEVTVKENLEGAIGGKLEESYVKQISFGSLDPSIEFVHKKGVFLSSTGNKNVEVKIVNVEDVEIKLYKVYENNILSFLGSSYYYDYYDEDYYDVDYGFDRSHIGNFGDLMKAWEVKVTDLPRNGNVRYLNLDMEDYLSGYEGLYVIEVGSEKDYWVKANKTMMLTDIGLIAKKGKNSVAVFANSIGNTEPVKNLDVFLIGKNNQRIAKGTTDQQGVVMLNMNTPDLDGFEPKLITAKIGDDYTFLPLDQTRVGTSRFDVGGKTLGDTEYDCFLFGERDLYRPGEIVHYAGIVRDSKGGKVSGMPLVVKLRNPEGKVISTLKKTLNSEGHCEMSFPVSAAAMTGTYQIEMASSSGLALTSTNVLIEEFVPDRIRVQLDLDEQTLFPGDELNIGITASSFFGPPAADRSYDIEVSTSSKNFNSRKHEGFNFRLRDQETYFENEMREGKTDSNGEVAETYDVDPDWRNLGLLQTSFLATVFDENGRPVKKKGSVEIITQDYFVGLSNLPYYTGINDPFEIQMLAVTRDDKATNAQAELQIIRHEYKTTLGKSGSYFRYYNEKVEKLLEKKTVSLKPSNNSYSFNPKISGEYEIRLRIPGASTYVSERFYAYGWSSTNASSFPVNNEGKIDISMDKDAYESGDVAKVLLKTPFDGKVLVTLERENVDKYFYIDTRNKAASFEVDLEESHAPNIYVSATLIKAHDVSAIPLTVAHGFENISVTHTPYQLPLEISAVAESRSKRSQTIRIKSTAGASVTIAAVDEGILQVSGFQTPDPYGYYYGKKGLEVDSYDVYPFLFPESEINAGRPGGGMDLENRVNPAQSKRFEMVSFWSGWKTCNSNGIAEFEVDIPAYSGELRIMAVASKNNTYASESKPITVADPIVLSAGIPRFLSPGDIVNVPLTVSNTTARGGGFNTALNVEGPLIVLGDSESGSEITSKSEGRQNFQIQVGDQLGAAKINFLTKGIGESNDLVTNINVRSPAPLEKKFKSGVLTNGQTRDFSSEGAFLGEGWKQTLVISNSPVTELAPQLSYLVRYPYGCTEQTVSAAFPQIYFEALSDGMFSETMNSSASQNVQNGINRLLLMQVNDGGLTYWPGSGQVNWWASTYAAHFLLEAQKAGFDVPEASLDKLLDYLEYRLNNNKLTTYYYNRNKRKQIYPKETSYSLFVLALAKRDIKSTLNFYKSNQSKLSLEGQYLMAAAFALSGDRRNLNQILPGGFQGEEAVPTYSGSFNSALRDEAISLYALLEIDPSHNQIAILSKHVADQLKNRKYLNTQERAFSLIALGRIARSANQSAVTGTVTSEGKQLGSFSGGTPLIVQTEVAGTRPLSIKASGNGSLFYFWEGEGIPAAGKITERDNFIQVRRKFYDREGNVISTSRIEQNELLVVEIILKSTNGSNVDNVAITDMLPAGFEIENPRLNDLPGASWIKNSSRPDYVDYRDDRVNIFTTAKTNESKFYYMVRAITKGTFQMGPVAADAMYNPEYHSYNGAGVVQVY